VNPTKARFEPVFVRVRRSISRRRLTLKQIHPELMRTNVRCSTCGTAFATRSTRSEIVVDVCSNCHPAYTGLERAVKAGSRIERFERRRAAARRPVVAATDRKE
jgi:large subunit ribosomal protein L31